MSILFCVMFVYFNLKPIQCHIYFYELGNMVGLSAFALVFCCGWTIGRDRADAWRTLTSLSLAQITNHKSTKQKLKQHNNRRNAKPSAKLAQNTVEHNGDSTIIARDNGNKEENSSCWLDACLFGTCWARIFHSIHTLHKECSRRNA